MLTLLYKYTMNYAITLVNNELLNYAVNNKLHNCPEHNKVHNHISKQ